MTKEILWVYVLERFGKVWSRYGSVWPGKVWFGAFRLGLVGHGEAW